MHSYDQRTFVTPTYDYCPKNVLNPTTGTLTDNPNIIHPINKAYIGQRLANSAAGFVYGISGMAKPGFPVVKAAHDSKGNVSALSIQFKDPKSSSPISLVNRRLASEVAVQGFEVLTSAGTWGQVYAVIRGGNEIEINTGNFNPTMVRYGYANFIVDCDLNQTDGLPVMPFVEPISP